MAEARKTTKKEERTAVITIETSAVELTLSEGEARTLLAVLDNVGGDAFRSPRKHTSEIGSALEDELRLFGDSEEHDLVRGEINFKTYHSRFDPFDDPETYDSPDDLPEWVEAFEDATGVVAVRVNGRDGPWWYVSAENDWEAREIRTGKALGHRAGGAIAPLTPIPRPDYL